MAIGLDRVIVAVDDLGAAVDDYTGLLGFEAETARAGGAPPATARFRLGNAAIELADRGLLAGVAPAPSAPGVAALVFLDDDAGEGRTSEEGPQADEWLPPSETRGIPIHLERASSSGAEPSARPAVAAGQISGLDHVVISTGDLEAARRLYGERLGLRLALDRSFEKRGIRILFFRIAGVTIEVVGRLPGAAASEGGPAAFAAASDRFGGLALQTGDVQATRARLAARGFDVSEDRAGHKPGTRVCSVRSGTHGVPTLVIGPDLG
jgi:catechol 2,3-dioxygenase-like lactoylglutathione lyase family enzyme